MAAVCLTGCRGRRTPSALLSELSGKTDSLLAKARTNAALEVLGGALDQPRYGTVRPEIIVRMLQIHFANGDTLAAAERYELSASAYPGAAQNAFTGVQAHLEGRNRQEDMVAWSMLLLGKNLPADALRRAWIYLAQTTQRNLYAHKADEPARVESESLDFIEWLLARAVLEADRAHAAALLLDGCFLANDFGRAAKALANGLPLKDEARRDMLAVKISAHQALSEGRRADAIALFREFMELLEPDRDFIDPLSGTRVTSRYVLGLNAARIGGLWSELGESERSRAACREAGEHYRLALRDVEPGSDEYRQIESSVARLPEFAGGD